MSAVESATTVVASTAMESVTVISAAVASPVTVAPAVAMAIVAPAVTIVRTPVISRSIIAVIPGACADEHTADKVARPVKSIGRAGIGIIVIVAIRANRRRPNRVSRTIAHAHSDLRRRMYCRYSQQDSKQREVL